MIFLKTKVRSCESTSSPISWRRKTKVSGVNSWHELVAIPFLPPGHGRPSPLRSAPGSFLRSRTWVLVGPSHRLSAGALLLPHAAGSPSPPSGLGSPSPPSGLGSHTSFLVSPARARLKTCQRLDPPRCTPPHLPHDTADLFMLFVALYSPFWSTGFIRAAVCICLVHSCIPSAWNKAWHVADTQLIFVDWTHEWFPSAPQQLVVSCR